MNAAVKGLLRICVGGSASASKETVGGSDSRASWFAARRPLFKARLVGPVVVE